MQQILRTILLIILVYYLSKFIVNYVVPIFRKGNQNKSSRNGRNRETIIDNRNDREKIISKEEGEYVDYEEIKEEPRQG